MDTDDICNTGLVLRLGVPSPVEFPPATTDDDDRRVKKQGRKSDQLPKGTINFGSSLTLGFSGEIDGISKIDSTSGSSFSNFSLKREVGSEEVETERVSSRASEAEDCDDEDDGGIVNPRKKLRLTKDQSALLEESFKLHSSLNPKQKKDLASKLNLRLRQVEVWFQNRRARTKLKQTEVNCDYLKKWCETLRDENKRLKKEIQELKALKLAQPSTFYMQLPAAATLTMCPSCERIGGGGGGGSGGGGSGGSNDDPKHPFSINQKPHFYNPFTNPQQLVKLS